MDIARLNKRIIIQKSEVIKDEVGNQIEEWVNWYSCYASADTRGRIDSEEEIAKMLVDHSIVNFTIRYNSKIKNLNLKEFRIYMGDELFNIKAIDWMNYNRKFIKIITKKVGR